VLELRVEAAVRELGVVERDQVVERDLRRRGADAAVLGQRDARSRRQ